MKYKTKKIRLRGLNGDKTKWIYISVTNEEDAISIFRQYGVWKYTVSNYTGKKTYPGNKKIYNGDICIDDEKRIFLITQNRAKLLNVVNITISLKELNIVNIVGNIYQYPFDELLDCITI